MIEIKNVTKKYGEKKALDNRRWRYICFYWTQWCR